MKAVDFIRKGWCQRFYAVDRDGLMVSATDTEACRWCSLGALRVAYGVNKEENPAYYKVLDILQVRTQRMGISLTAWNDATGRTQEEVIALFEEAGV